MTDTDWLIPGAQVAEQKNGTYDFTTVKRVTDTMVVLDNGSRYKLDTMRKVGEKTSYDRTWLIRAEQARRQMVKETIRQASTVVSQASYQVTENNAPAAEALDKMQAAIDEARRKLAELDPEAKLDTEAAS